MGLTAPVDLPTYDCLRRASVETLAHVTDAIAGAEKGSDFLVLPRGVTPLREFLTAAGQRGTPPLCPPLMVCKGKQLSLSEGHSQLMESSVLRPSGKIFNPISLE